MAERKQVRSSESVFCEREKGKGPRAFIWTVKLKLFFIDELYMLSKLPLGDLETL